ncbi:transporter substrate-binding domain-containing protein [Bradyrhizobium jicamae]|uniref:Transporter substrate-binding domain-containing protein n=1 Tax=Bradyrhizobium jicamae TaxID=280332 RepID=A0ABS5FEX0_9BRAD|nr:transporter substrate-binding domain-containing protein [Bradyrhizobium jicamae]MBR0795347.1 transporter substrate-binding domain-containing protein [Bradyrhizobium jicamae]MBR0932769.1 transporter substrate-binding domain-containing protein [Bradyrhizobium jicamae]
MVTRRQIGSLVGLGAAAAIIADSAGSQAVADNAPAPGESTFAQIRRTKKLRIAGIVGTEPYYHKDLATGQWSGFCVSMATDLAKALEAEVEIIESTWGNSVLDLQANKIDIMFGLSPTPSRALVVEFTRPIMNNTFTIIAKPDFAARSWEDLNKPEMRVAVDIGSTHDLFARRTIPKATLVALRTPDDAVLSLQSGRADCLIQVAMLSLVTVKKNPRLGKVSIPTPVSSQPTCCGVRVDLDSRFRTYVDNWLEYNRSLGALREWIISSLSLVGIQEQDIPPGLQF